MISPIEKKCVKCGQPWEQHDQNYCHSPVEKNDAEIERIVEEVFSKRAAITANNEKCTMITMDELRTTLLRFKEEVEGETGWNTAQIKDLRNLGHLLQAMYGKRGTEAIFDTIQDVADKLEKNPNYHPRP